MNYKTKDISIKMFHVINNSLATSDGFTYYNISFGIKHANASQQGREYSVAKHKALMKQVSRRQQTREGNTRQDDQFVVLLVLSLNLPPSKASSEIESRNRVLLQNLHFVLNLPLGGRMAQS